MKTSYLKRALNKLLNRISLSLFNIERILVNGLGIALTSFRFALQGSDCEAAEGSPSTVRRTALFYCRPSCRYKLSGYASGPSSDGSLLRYCAGKLSKAYLIILS